MRAAIHSPLPLQPLSDLSWRALVVRRSSDLVLLVVVERARSLILSMFLQSSSLVKITGTRLFLSRIVRLSWLAGFTLACAFVTIAPPAGLAGAVEDAPLLALATRKFPNLTFAERALLVFADRNNLARG